MGKKLIDKKIDFILAKPSQVIQSTKFDCDGFETNLNYDNSLYDVQQYKYFDQENKNTADDFFIKMIRI